MRKSILSRLAGIAVLGALCLASVPLARAQTNLPPWLHKVRAGEIVYFAFAAPARIERYDLAQERWLAPISLAEEPTAVHVDSAAIYVASGRALRKRALDGSGDQPVYNAADTIRGILTDANFIFAFLPGYAHNRIDSVRKADSQFVATWTGTYSISAGFSIAPTQRRIFGVNTETTAFSAIELPYNADGTFATATSIWGSGTFSDRAHTWVSPSERALVRSNGQVYSTPGLAPRGSLAGGIEDAGWHGADVLITLRGDKLVAFDNTYLESGVFALAATAHGIAVRLGEIHVFTGNGAQMSGVAVEKIAVTRLTAAQPGTPLNPAWVGFIPDDVQQAEDGSLLLLSRNLQSIFRWSPATRSFTASYSLLGSPTLFTYSRTLRRIYTAYASGAIYQIRLDLGQSTETPFTNLTNGPGALVAADNHLFVAEGGSFYYYRMFSHDGVRTYASDQGGYTGGFLWAAAQRRLYYVDYSQLGYHPVDFAGQLGSRVGALSSINTPSAPLRLATDGSTILGTNGYVYRTSDLSYGGALSNAVHDAVSRAGNWVSIRPAGSATQLQTWTSGLFFDRGITVPGVPMRIFNASDDRLVVLTSTAGEPGSTYYGTPRNAGRLIFSVVDLAGAGTVTSSPIITTEPASTTFYRGRPASLTVVAEGASLTYQWRRNGADIVGATNATFSVENAQDVHIGSYLVLVGSPYGSVPSVPATVTVQDAPPPPVITAQPQPLSVQVGGYASMSVGASGTGLGYQWRKNGTAIAGATSYQLSWNPVAAADYADYDVVVSNGGGSVTSATAALSPPPAPTITAQPQNVIAAVGAYVSFSVSATSTGVSYQWRKDGVALPGGNSSYLSLGPITSAHYGAYDVVVSNSGGTVTSAVARLYPPVRLAALTARAHVPAAGATFVVVVSSPAESRLLIRAAGPALAATGVAGTHPDPRLELYNAANVQLASNQDWGGAENATVLATESARVGALPFAAGSKDAALLAVLADGVYTVTVAGDGSAGGTALLELYDLSTPAAANRLTYFAARAPVAPGQPLVVGLSPEPAGTRHLFVRGWGPALGADGMLTNPALSWANAITILQANDDWGTGGASAAITQRTVALGLTPFNTGSRDAALLPSPELDALPYTATLTAVGETAGEAVLELVDSDGYIYSGVPPIILVGPATQTVAAGRDVPLTVRAAGMASPTTYLWRKNGMAIAGATESSLLLRSVQPGDAGSYTVTLSRSGRSTTSRPAVITVTSTVPSVNTATHGSVTGYAPGGTVVVTNTLAYVGTPSSLGWSVEIPAGWSYAGSTGDLDMKPATGTTGVLEWAWSNIPPSPVTFTYTLNVPLTASGPQALTAAALVRTDGVLSTVAVTPNPLVVQSGTRLHTADTNGDRRISLSEMTRVIELYNTFYGTARTGCYRVATGLTEDGFSPDPGRLPSVAVTLPGYHAADANRDGRFSLAELTRVIELYNFRSGTVRTGEYRVQAGTEDGFAAGP